MSYIITCVILSLIGLSSAQSNSQICLEKVFNVDEDNGHSVLNIIDVPGSNGDWIAVGLQLGIVFLWSSADANVVQRELPLMDISNRVDRNGERGLLGLAFHKEFAKNGRIFASFSCSGIKEMQCAQGASIVEEFAITGDLADPRSWRCSGEPVRRVMDIAHPEKNHNGGQILFSKDPKDGNLFVMFGDGGGAGDPHQHSQDLMSLQGKVLRVNIDGVGPSQNYSIPHDNPFASSEKARPEIYAYGLRNPWRCSFDSISFALLCGDVGQDKVEEVDEIFPGHNYGWRPFEGSVPFSPADTFSGKHTLPIYEYFRTGSKSGASVIGGYIYHPAAWTDKCLHGKYIFGDYYQGLMLGTYDSAAMSVVKSSFSCAKDSPLKCGNKLDDLATFGEDGRGRIYISSGNGIFRLADPSRCGIKC